MKHTKKKKRKYKTKKSEDVQLETLIDREELDAWTLDEGDKSD